MSASKASAIDPVTLAVIQAGLQQVCAEMDLAFVRSAFSPVIKPKINKSFNPGLLNKRKIRNMSFIF